MAPNPISFSEIKAYSDLMGVEFTPRDVDSIKRIDAAYLRANNG
jgi:hypothetical protein